MGCEEARGWLGKARSAGPRRQHRPLSRQSCNARRRSRGVEASDLLQWPASVVPCTKADAQAAQWGSLGTTILTVSKDLLVLPCAFCRQWPCDKRKGCTPTWKHECATLTAVLWFRWACREVAIFHQPCKQSFCICISLEHHGSYGSSMVTGFLSVPGGS